MSANKKSLSRKSLLEQEKARAMEASRADEDAFWGSLSSALARISLPGSPYKGAKSKKTQRALNLLVSDTHFGASLDPREVPSAYGPLEESRRFAAICAQVASYKLDHRNETVLNIHLAGDIIQNQLHDLRDGQPLAEQVAAAIHILANGIAFLAKEFKRIVVRCTPGNHGRSVSRHKQRATLQKWDSIENMVYFALKTALQSIKHVSFEIPYTPFFTYESFGQACFITHGDTVIAPGNISKSINIQTIRNQVNEINSAGKHYSLFAIGHVHTPVTTILPNGVVLITNGALIPADSYAVSCGLLQNQCGQQLWESVEGHVLGDSRFIMVGPNEDKDKSLSKIIPPFKGMNN